MSMSLFSCSGEKICPTGSQPWGVSRNSLLHQVPREGVSLGASGPLGVPRAPLTTGNHEKVHSLPAIDVESDESAQAFFGREGSWSLG